MRRSLRTRLVLSFGLLVVVLAVYGWASVVWLGRLGDSVAVILRENYRSVAAMQDAKEALERMDSGALFALTGDPAQGRTLTDVYGPRFEAALAAELANITLPGEEEKARRLGELWTAYFAVLGRVLAPEESLEARRALYHQALLPRFEESKKVADEILKLNQENMAAAAARSRELAARGRQQLYLLLLLGAVLTAVAVASLERRILQPLRRLTSSARDIEAGRLDQLVDVPSTDELGQLALAFNAMARRLRELRTADAARIQQARRTSQLAIDGLADPVVLLGRDGAVELANAAARVVLGVQSGKPVLGRHAEWLDRLLAAGDEGVGEGWRNTVQLSVDGVERCFRPRVATLRDGVLGELGSMILFSDVTALRRIDEIPTTAAVVADVAGRGATPEERQALLVRAREDVERLRHTLDSLLAAAHLEEERPTGISLPEAGLQGLPR